MCQQDRYKVWVAEEPKIFTKDRDQNNGGIVSLCTFRFLVCYILWSSLHVCKVDSDNNNFSLLSYIELTNIYLYKVLSNILSASRRPFDEEDRDFLHQELSNLGRFIGKL